MYNQVSNAYNNGPMSSGLCSSSITIQPPKPPAQRPTEFAAQLLEQSLELNSRLAHLRAKLFGEGEANPALDRPKELSLEGLIQSAHFQLNEAISQLDGIQNRL